MLRYGRIMYIMLRGMVIDGHDSLNLTPLSLVYRFVNILYIWSIFLLLNTFFLPFSVLKCILSL
jgi:hypothetical protein